MAFVSALPAAGCMNLGTVGAELKQLESPKAGLPLRPLGKKGLLPPWNPNPALFTPVTLVFQLLQQDIHLFTQLFLIVEQVWSLVCEEVAFCLHDVGPQVGLIMFNHFSTKMFSPNRVKRLSGPTGNCYGSCWEIPVFKQTGLVLFYR